MERQRAIVAILYLFVTLYLPACPCLYAAAKENGWREVTPGMFIMELPYRSRDIFDAKALFLRSSLKRFSLSAVRALDYGIAVASVKRLAKLSGAQAVINANFFDPQHKPLGLVVHRGIMLNPLQRKGRLLTGILGFSNGNASVMHRDRFSRFKVEEAIQAGPRLVAGGSVVKGLDNVVVSRRSGVCIRKDGDIVFYIIYPSGLTLKQTALMLVQPEIGCRDALNLDGGSSSQLYLCLPKTPDNQCQERYIEGVELVPVGLALISRN